MRQCRYLEGGFWPKRRGLFLVADFMTPGFNYSPPWRFRALTAERLARKAYARYAALGYRSVALHENGATRDKCHLFGPEWHGAGCTHIDGQVDG